MKQRVADYIADFLVSKGIDTVFTVVGGGAMHLNDAFGKCDRLRVIHNHHEQACAMAAEGYARIKEAPAAVCVTTGPGGTNALTGVLGAWQDNIPMIVISGQVRYSTTVENSGLNLRQFGEQEYCIVRSVEPMTKYAYMIKDVSEVRQVLEKAYHLSTTGRRGPVWIDVPLNVQGATIENENLRGYTVPKEKNVDNKKVAELFKKLREAKKPLILAGASIRRSGAYDVFRKLVDRLNIPVLAATCFADLMPSNHALYYGNFGVVGGRCGNFLVQNADIILMMGCRGSLKQIGFNYEEFAPDAYKIMIDIDEEELKKETLKIDFPVVGDIREVLTIINENIPETLEPKSEWLEYARILKNEFPIVPNDNSDNGVNPYSFAYYLMENLSMDGIVVTGNSSGAVMALHCGTTKEGQRLFSNLNCGSMGWDLPAAMGAEIASGKSVICLTGDGSVQMNLQELQTMVCNDIPVKVVIYNNNGYMGIVRTQRNFFDGRLTGCTPESGLDCPDFGKIAEAYNIPHIKLKNMKEVKEQLIDFLNAPGYGICELEEDSTQGPAFKTTSKQLESGEIVSAPLDELAPLLSPEIFEKYRYYEPGKWK